MKQFTFFHPLVFSFFSKDLYRDVAYRWKGAGLLYLLFAVTLCWIVLCVRLHFAVSSMTDEAMPIILAKVPPVTITKGVATVEAPQPFIINDPGSGKVIAILDTTGQYNTLADTKGAMLLLTQTHIHMLNQNSGKIDIHPLATLPDMSLTPETLKQLGESFKALFAVILFPMCVIGSYIFRALQLLLYGAVATVICESKRVKLELAARMRLAAVAVTPVLILNTLLWAADIDIPVSIWWPLCIAITLGYLYFGINAAAESPPDEQVPLDFVPRSQAVGAPAAGGAAVQSPWDAVPPAGPPPPSNS